MTGTPGTRPRVIPQWGSPAFDLSGPAAAAFLSDAGIEAPVSPPIRSSDLGSCATDPFSYFLHRRLSLADPLRWSKALNRGTWFHHCMDYLTTSKGDRMGHIKRLLVERADELKVAFRQVGMGPETAAEWLAREERDAKAALGWCEALQDVPCDESGKTLIEWFKFTNRIASEVHVGVNWTHQGELIPVLAQIDLLVYHKPQNKVYVVDWKTCTESASARASTCPIEHQTWHYLLTLAQAMRSSRFRQKYQLPADATVGGMVHVCVQKPTIDFGMNDRPRYLLSDSKRNKKVGEARPRRNGEWACTVVSAEGGELLAEETIRGEVEAAEWLLAQTGKKAENTFEGEPSHDQYIQRCSDWYHTRGMYLNLAEARKPGDVFNISTTYMDELTPIRRDRYFRQLLATNAYRTCDPDPGLFPMNPSNCMSHGKPHKFTPFYLKPVLQWPSIIREQGLIQLSREARVADDDFFEEIDHDAL